MNDYDRIALVIRHLQEHYAGQPDLDELAGLVGLSRYHFHRLFQRWAGITPKAFVQFLTARQVRQSLLVGKSVLETALASGLSGPSRLHDLCLKLEAATPGEIKSGGAGWIIEAGMADSPFGKAVVAKGPRGICHLSFVLETADGDLLSGVARDWPAAAIRRDDKAAGQLVRAVFNRTAKGPLQAVVRGTAFQVKVWRALLEIPTGQTVPYGALARSIGQPEAARAVGKAVGSNPIAFLIPCHRVIRTDGGIGGYKWGTVRKQAMLARETLNKNVRIS